MRTFMVGAVFMAVAGILGGCESTAGNHPTMAQAQHAATPANGGACVLQSGGANVLKVATPERARCTNKDGSLFIKTPKYDVELWVVSGAHSVDEAVNRVPAQIVEEFKNFKATRTSDLTVAGSPAKRLTGTGQEADDGDPGEADVIVFKLGDRIFIGCNHGEGLTPEGQQGLLTLVQSAQRP